MISFRSTRNALRDSLTAYLLVAGLGVSLLIMGVTSSVYSDRLDENARSERLRAVYECADLLRGYDSAERADERVEASIGFRDTVLRLDCGDELKAALCDYAGRMRYGYPEYPPPSVLAELFSMAAATDDLSGLSEVFVSSDAAVGSLSPRWLKAAAMSDAKLLTEGIYGLPKLAMRDGRYTMRASNLLITFSESDGRMEEFFYLRLGSAGAATDIASLASGLSDGAEELSLCGELCGYRLFEGDSLRFVVDRSGRLIAALKVKR